MTKKPEDIYIGRDKPLTKWKWKVTFTDETYLQGKTWTLQNARLRVLTVLKWFGGDIELLRYTPTTEEVSKSYVWFRDQAFTDEKLKAEFDRWFAEVIRKAKEEAWDEGWVSETFVWNPYRQGETE